ncbi:hypothetical protein AB0P02_01010 [Streptomyces griseoluteus]|uniref:hypothetical protein n=1 Tax=Streptomyces griseoluteus TaxID=29306 RepID=UPI00343440D5
MNHSKQAVAGVPVGRHRDWIAVTTLSVPTVWMATPDGIVCLDLIAVELAANGRRQGWTPSAHEAAYAAHLLFARGMDYSVIAARMGVSGATLRTWYPTDDTPLHEALARIKVRQPAQPVIRTPRPPDLKSIAQCGTYAGYQLHRKYGEPRCEPCQAARRARVRYRRKYGTYDGAPTTPEEIAKWAA